MDVIITLTELLTAYEVAKGMEREGRDHPGLTASAFTGCIRRKGYEFADHPITDPRPATSVATVGSLLHVGVAVLWVQRGYEVEITGEHGTADAVHRERKEVRDLKSVSRSRFDYWTAKDGPPEKVWKQAHVYGHDHGADESWTVVIDVLCRETGRSKSYAAPFDPGYAAKAVAELAEQTEQVAQGLPPIPDDRYGHDDPVCENCPFLTACWGEGEPNDHPVFDEDDIQRFAVDYLDAQAAKKEADDRMKVAKSRLVGVKGEHGPVKVTWREVAGSHVEYDRKPYKQLNVSRVD